MKLLSILASVFYKSRTTTSASVSIGSWATMSVMTTHEVIQSVAGVVAIIAGLVAIINGIDTFRKNHKKRHNEKKNSSINAS